MIRHSVLKNKEVLANIRTKKICLGGNEKLRIYGMLSCPSGKRMKRENRVFFRSETEAQEKGYRPCGRCLYNNYKEWKNGLV